MTIETTDFWADLQELRRLSLRVLSALETDDLDSVARFASRSDELLERVRPEIEARSLAGDEELGDLLTGLRTMNDRIVELLNEKREATRNELESMRVGRVNHLKYQSGGQTEPELLDLHS